MNVDPKLLIVGDQMAADVVTLYGQIGVVCSVVRQGENHPRVFSPLGYERQSAEMLYQSADAMAEHASPTKPPLPHA